MGEPILTNTGWAAYNSSAQVLGGYATAIGAAIAAISLLLILLQSVWNARVAREAAALDVHKEFLRLCVEMPELSSSNLALEYLKRKDFVGVLDDLTIESERMLWFLSYMLHSGEQLLGMSQWLWWSDKAWVNTVKVMVFYHDWTLVEVWPAWRDHYGPRFQRIVDEIVKNAGPVEVRKR